LFLLLTPVLTLATAERAQAADHQATNQLEMKARESFAAGRYAEALETFAKLYAETLHPVYLRNIGRCHQKLREPDKAIDAFTDYLAKTKSGKDKISADERTEIQGYIKDMETLRDEQTKAAAPVPAVVTPIPTAAPATSMPPPSAPPPSSTSAAATLTVTPPPPGESHPVYKRWWFWTIVGVVVVGGVVTTLALTSGGKPGCSAPAGVPDFRGCM
jgi:hypothetical protein